MKAFAICGAAAPAGGTAGIAVAGALLTAVLLRTPKASPAAESAPGSDRELMAA